MELPYTVEACVISSRVIISVLTCPNCGDQKFQTVILSSKDLTAVGLTCMCKWGMTVNLQGGQVRYLTTAINRSENNGAAPTN